MAFLGVPIVILCYCLVNVSFFAVLSYEQIESAEAVGLVYNDNNVYVHGPTYKFKITNFSGVW